MDVNSLKFTLRQAWFYLKLFSKCLGGPPIFEVFKTKSGGHISLKKSQELRSPSKPLFSQKPCFILHAQWAIDKERLVLQEWSFMKIKNSVQKGFLLLLLSALLGKVCVRMPKGIGPFKKPLGKAKLSIWQNPWSRRFGTETEIPFYPSPMAGYGFWKERGMCPHN